MAFLFDIQWGITIDMIRYAKRIMILTGAGISTDSGIQDFRSPGGLWEFFNPMKYADFANFLAHPEFYWELEKALIPIFANAKPNLGHKALVEFEKKIGEKFVGIITQNIDNFHQIAGNKTPILELHGNVLTAYCLDCGQQIKRGYILKRLKMGDLIPKCFACGGRIKTGIVLFNEPINDDVIQKAIEMVESCDLLLVLGSSLLVAPANQLILFAKKKKAKLIFINKDPTVMDKYCDIRFLGNISDILPSLVREI